MPFEIPYSQIFFQITRKRGKCRSYRYLHCKILLITDRTRRMHKSLFEYVERIAWYKHPISEHGSAVQRTAGRYILHESGARGTCKIHRERREEVSVVSSNRMIINCTLTAINPDRLTAKALSETFYTKHFTRSMCSLMNGAEAMN